MNTIPPPVETPPFDKQMICYLLAIYLHRLNGDTKCVDEMPTWVPSAIRVERPVHGQWPDNRHSIVVPGDWPCTTTVNGVIFCLADDGNTIAVSLFDCEILAFRWNAKRATFLSEQAAKAAMEVIP